MYLVVIELTAQPQKVSLAEVFAGSENKYRKQVASYVYR